MMGRWIYFGACVLVLAGITHIAIILMIPAFGTKDAFAILSRTIDPLQFRAIDVDDPQSPLADVDPFFAYGVCRFELSEDGVRLAGERIDGFWSATILDQDGTVVYSLNNRTAADQRLDLILLSPLQILRLRELQPPEVESAIVVEADMDGGFAVLRVFQPDTTFRQKAKDFLQSVRCDAYVPTRIPSETETEDEPAS